MTWSVSASSRRPRRGLVRCSASWDRLSSSRAQGSCPASVVRCAGTTTTTAGGTRRRCARRTSCSRSQPRSMTGSGCEPPLRGSPPTARCGSSTRAATCRERSSASTRRWARSPIGRGDGPTSSRCAPRPRSSSAATTRCRPTSTTCCASPTSSRTSSFGRTRTGTRCRPRREPAMPPARSSTSARSRRTRAPGGPSPAPTSAPGQRTTSGAWGRSPSPTSASSGRGSSPWTPTR